MNRGDINSAKITKFAFTENMVYNQFVIIISEGERKRGTALYENFKTKE